MAVCAVVGVGRWGRGSWRVVVSVVDRMQHVCCINCYAATCPSIGERSPPSVSYAPSAGTAVALAYERTHTRV